MEIGTHVRTVIVEPIEDPFREPAPEDPVREVAPESEPVEVPA